MIYRVGMLVKHFKGATLLEKNIYKIVGIFYEGREIDERLITYTGDGDLKSAKNLVIYANIFQHDKMFAREYESMIEELSDEKKLEFHQTIKVEPLTAKEIKKVGEAGFIERKAVLTNL